MNDEVVGILGRVGTTQLAVESLRANNVDRALELLELDLDASILALSRISREADPPQRDHVVQTLRLIRAYRQAHPRRVEGDLSTLASGLVVRAGRGARERVREILDQTE